MNRLYANLAILSRAAAAIFNKFQAKPLRKAPRYDSVATMLCSPLVITRAECDRIVETLGRALQTLAID